MRSALVIGVLSALLACEKTAPPAAAPPIATATPLQLEARITGNGGMASVTAEPENGASNASLPAAVPEVAPPPDEPRQPSRSPIDMLTMAGTAFLINYSASAPAERARSACAQQKGEDDDALAQCQSDARDAFKADVFRFKPDGNRWIWIIYKRTGNRLDELYSARIELAEDSPSRVRMKLLGGERGARPVLKNRRESLLQIPNDYSVVLIDAEQGQLVYEAKLGLIGS